MPLHITQRGINRWPTFLEDVDLAFYRLALYTASRESGCKVHAYALMTNHVHLLLTPTHALGPSRLMQSLGRRYVRYFNDRYRRSGPLWEGRYRSAPIASDVHLLCTYRYIELNPVRASMVRHPAQYEWSSFRCNALGAPDPIIEPHPSYSGLGRGESDRREAYVALFSSELAPDAVAAIRAGTRSRFEPRATTYENAVTSTNERLVERRGADAVPWPAFPTAIYARDR